MHHQDHLVCFCFVFVFLQQNGEFEIIILFFINSVLPPDVRDATESWSGRRWSTIVGFMSTSFPDIDRSSCELVIPFCPTIKWEVELSWESKYSCRKRKTYFFYHRLDENWHFLNVVHLLPPHTKFKCTCNH